MLLVCRLPLTGESGLFVCKGCLGGNLLEDGTFYTGNIGYIGDNSCCYFDEIAAHRICGGVAPNLCYVFINCTATVNNCFIPIIRNKTIYGAITNFLFLTHCGWEIQDNS